MPDSLSFIIKKQFDRYFHDPIIAIVAIPLFLILKIAKNKPINIPKNIEADNNFNVIKAPPSNLGKLAIIRSISINILYYI